MAVRHGYGKIEGTDALVFAYDTGDTVNSYKGRPTTNYGPADFADWTPEAGTAGDTAERIPTGNYYKGQPTYNCRVDVTQQYRGIYKTITDLATIAGAGGTITVSCMIKNNNSRTDQYINAFIGHDFSSVRWVAANSDWQKVQWTVNASNLNNNNVEFRPVTRVTDEYLEMTMPMVEVNVGSASQFVNGTRSATEGLKDLTGNTSIDLTNAGFDSNAQIDFDGTGDFFDVDGIANFQPNNTTDGFTVEYVFKSDTVTPTVFVGNLDSTNGWFQAPIATSGNGAYLYLNGSPGVVLNTDVNFRINSTNINKYHHVVMSLKWDDAANSFIMVDGVDQTNSRSNVSKQSTSGIPSPGLRVGKRGSSIWPANGQIPVVKCYNRALTAAEVKNNYRHYKNRFNI